MTNPSPLRYPGGKFKTYKYVEQLIEINNSNIYIEPFAGGSAVSLQLLINNKVKQVYLNDYDRSIYAFWYCVLYKNQEFIDLIRETPISMDNWFKQKEIQKNKHQESLLSLGFSTFFLNRTNRSGIIKAGVIGGITQSGNYKLDCRYSKEKLIEKVKIIGDNRDKFKIFNVDATEFISDVIVDTKGAFTFFDPPYYQKGPGLYTNFFKHEDHYKLSKVIQEALNDQKWIVTYDYNEEIKKMYSSLSYKTYILNYSADRKRQASEYMFFSNKTNIPESKALKFID
ncbi:hypothetical protein BSAF29S_01199 [Bacillus safensis subsp. safensis]|uniref:DNA adenine methylase n=1 Tax=Bacillus sp. FSL M8-0049 TaxID=2954573 RepID=UPI0031583E93